MDNVLQDLLRQLGSGGGAMDADAARQHLKQRIPAKFVANAKEAIKLQFGTVIEFGIFGF